MADLIDDETRRARLEAERLQPSIGHNEYSPGTGPTSPSEPPGPPEPIIPEKPSHPLEPEQPLKPGYPPETGPASPEPGYPQKPEQPLKPAKPPETTKPPESPPAPAKPPEPQEPEPPARPPYYDYGISKPPDKRTGTVVINGIEYGIGAPLPGMYRYVEWGPEGWVVTAGGYVPLDKGPSTQPSNELNELVKKIMAETGLSNEEALRVINDYSTDPEHSALLNKYPKLNRILEKELVGEAWKDIRNGVPVTATDDNDNKTTMIISNAVAEKISKMKPEEQFNELKKLGIYPQDWVWTNGMVLSGEQLKLVEDQGRAYTALLKAGALTSDGRLDLMKAIDQRVADEKILAWLGNTKTAQRMLQEAHDSITKFIETLTAQDPDAAEAFKKGGIEGYRNFVSNRLTSFENELKESDPAGYAVYKEKGLDDYIKFVKEREKSKGEALAAVSLSRDKQQLFDYNDAMYTLSKYKVEIPGQTDQAYDIERFIKENPSLDSVAVLRRAGFSQDIINRALEFVNKSNDAVAEFSELVKGDKLLDYSTRTVMEIQADNLGLLGEISPGLYRAGLMPIGDPLWGSPDMMIMNYKDYWDSLTELEKRRLINAINEDPNRGNAFAAFMETVTHDYEKMPTVMKYAIPFIPVVGMPALAFKETGTTIGKALTGQEISAMEVAIDAALVGISFLGVGGLKALPAKAQTPAGVSISAGAGSIFAVHTAQEWNNMSLAEKGLAVTMTALMFAPLASYMRSGINKLLKEPSLAIKQQQALNSIFERDLKAFEKVISKEPGANASEFAVKYNSWIKNLKSYADLKLKIAQAKEAVEGIRFATTSQEHKLLMVLKNRVKILESKIPALEKATLESTEKYTESLKDIIKTDDPAVMSELDNLARRSIQDMDLIAERIVKPREIENIKTDIDKAIRETAGLSERDPIPGKSLILQTDYLNALNRELYMTRLSKLQKLQQLSSRADTLSKQIQQAASPELKAPLERKMLEIEAKRLELKADLFKGFERTTEAVEGKVETKTGEYKLKETYRDVIERIENLRDNVIDRIKNLREALDAQEVEASVKAKVDKAINDYEWAIRYKDPALLNMAKRNLQLVGRELPKQLKNSQWQRALRRAYKAEDIYIKEKGKPEINDKDAETRIKTMENEIKANERHIDSLMKRAKSREAKKELQERLELMKRQLEREKKLLTETKTKLEQPLQKTAKTGENLPAKVEETTKKLTQEKTKKLSEESQRKIDQELERLKEKTTTRPSVKPRPFSLPAKEKEKETPSPARISAPFRPVPIPVISPQKKFSPKVIPWQKPFVIPGEETETETKFKPLPMVWPLPLTAPAKKTETETATETETLTETEPVTVTKPQVETLTATQTQPASQQKVQTVTDTKTQTEVITTKEKEKRKPILGGGSKEKKEWTPEEIKSAIAVKTGAVVHALKSPYRPGIDSMTFNANKLPPGLIVMNTRGKGSAQRSVKVTGHFPSKLTIDVGNQDLTVKRGKSGKVYLDFKRDTTGTVSQTTIKHLGRNVSQKRGRVYHTKSGNSTVLSRRPVRGF